MEENTLSLIIAISAFAIALAAFFRAGNRSTEAAAPVQQDQSLRPLQLQAYERLVILTERISLPNLINRVYQPHFTASEMQTVLLENIRHEFEYNASQQIYVSQKAWEAVRNLRDQNMLVINSIARSLPADAKGGELNRQIIESLMKEETGALHSYVANTLNEEAKRLL